MRAIACLLVATTFAFGCNAEPPTIEPTAATGYVGSQVCADCHQLQYDEWQGSHHQLAMLVAGPESVLGDFVDQRLTYFDEQIRLSTSAGDYFMTFVDDKGHDETVKVSHAFGVYPLQQYLVETSGGRKQALPVVWDTRPIDEGGQRWFHLYPDTPIRAGDPLHWRERFANWNFMCAECHSTNVRTGYDITTDTFNTTYSEVSVGCEGCHGPGDEHTRQASAQRFDPDYGFAVTLDDRQGARWVIDSNTGLAQRSEPAAGLQQPESCGRCHARRGVIAPEYTHGVTLADTHLPALLERGLYHADGRILDEVYVYGSFLQSKMYRAGVTCSDCHNPHSAKLKAGPDPNATCNQCHLPARFASEEHGGGASVGECVNCHMPIQTYMGIDDRRDHSFRLPNTATDPDHYGAIIAAGRANNGSANAQLLEGIARADYPAIARATMLTLLGPTIGDRELDTLTEQLKSSEPMIRHAALRTLANAPVSVRMRSGGSALLRDPVRSVRVQAAVTFLEARQLLAFNDAEAFADAADEYRATARLSASTPEASLSLAQFERTMGNAREAAALFAHAAMVGPDFAPAQYAYGLHLVRAGSAGNALNYLRAAMTLAPDEPRYAYVFGVALNSLGRADEAIGVLREAHTRFPNDYDIGWALATIYRDQRRYRAAHELLDAMHMRFPNRDEIIALRRSLPAPD
ncbi:MAG: tetratricopeptide repeat protein [Pseudomonadota bacterium]